MDQGGVQKEFFQVLIDMLLDPAYGMFVYDEETRYNWINGASLENEKQYELVGSVIGLALYNGGLTTHFNNQLSWALISLE
jgi:ubiquitin-protein ligase E3 A